MENITLIGKLKYFFLSDILQLISSAHKSGTIKLEHGEQSVTIIFTEGTIVFASGSKTESKLGFLLKSKGLISDEKLEQFLKISIEKNIALGKLLVEENVISLDALKAMIKKQIEEIFYDLFFWEGGKFSFDETEPDLNRIIASPLDLVFLVLEASRRVDEMTVLKEHIPNNHIVFKITDLSKKKDIKFVSNEWSILNLIDGQRNIQDIIEASKLDKFTIYKMLFSLISSGYIQKVNP